MDTETVNRPGRGEACVIGRMTDNGPLYLESPKGFDHIFNFLAGSRLVCWNMDFDARAIFHPCQVPASVIEDVGLFGRGKWRGYSIKYIPQKLFEVRGRKTSFVLYDLQQFYDCSLDTASSKYLGERKIKIPSHWYNRMDYYLKHERKKVLEYLARDLSLTQRHLDHLIKSVGSLGIKVERLTSAASLTKQYFREELENEKMLGSDNWAFRDSFYGGRIEVNILGQTGPCEGWDLHSAYPSILARLPTTRGLRVDSGPEWKYRGADYGVYKVLVDIPRDWDSGPLALRHDNTVLYPVGRFITRCGTDGIKCLRRNGIKFRVLSAREIFSSSKRPIFGNKLRALYRLRKDPALKLGVKKVMNSLYGGLGEENKHSIRGDLECGGRLVLWHRIKARAEFGRYTNFAIAARTTEAIRIKIWETAHRSRLPIYSFATDGILAAPGLKLKTGPNLGQWGDCEKYKRGVIFGCGRYALYPRRSGDPSKFALRGFPVSSENIKKILRSRRDWFRINQLSTATMREWCVMQAADYNVLSEYPLVFRVEDNKRWWPRKLKTLRSYSRQQVLSRPLLFWEKYP